MSLGIYIVLSIAIVCSLTLAEAAPDSMGVFLSDTCLTLLKHNMTTNCPTYEEILTIFPDNSNQYVSGQFVYHDGIYQRDTKHMKNHYDFYRWSDEDIFWVDPPGDVITKMKRIVITPTDFVYKIGEQTITNASVKVGQSRYISSTCSYAIITAANWLFLLGDTIQHMKEDCSAESTNFDEIKIRQWEATRHDISTSAKWKLEQWIKQVKENCLNEFLKCRT